MQEIWKDIKGYEGLYEVSNLGNVKNIKGLILKNYSDKNGYLRVYLYNNFKRKTCMVHRLVAEAFLDNPNNYPQVNHKNEDKSCNTVDNLEWCNVKYNCNYGKRNEKIKKKVIQYDKKNNLIKEWNCVTEAENKLNISHISSCCKNKRKTAGGYVWKYKD